MGVACAAGAEIGRFNALLRRLQKTECSDGEGHVPAAAHGLVFRLAW